MKKLFIIFTFLTIFPLFASALEAEMCTAKDGSGCSIEEIRQKAQTQQKVKKTKLKKGTEKRSQQWFKFKKEAEAVPDSIPIEPEKIEP